MKRLTRAPCFDAKGVRGSIEEKWLSMIELDEKKRIIQEFVPGKQVTLAHVIANPDESLYPKLGLLDIAGAIGIFTITPSEAAMIAADVATKAAEVEIGFIDRFNGSLVISGTVAAVEAALAAVIEMLCETMGFAPAPISKS
jgi:ethanolamine utilization protein EutS